LTLAATFGRGEMADRGAIEIRIPQPGADLILREAETAVGLGLAQELEGMRREIDDEHPPAGREKPRRLAQGATGIVEIVEDLMHHHEIKTVALERGSVDVALPQFDPVQSLRLEIGAGDREHGVTGVEPHGPGGLRREQGQHPARPGAEIDQAAIRPPAQSLDDRRLYRGLGHVKGAQPVPLRRQSSEEVLRGLRPLLANGGETGTIAGKNGICPVELLQNGGEEARHGAVLRQPEERPGALPVTAHETGLDEQFEMPGDPRLRLAENVRQIGHGQFARAQESQHAQTGLFAGRAQSVEGVGRTKAARRRSRHKDMFISAEPISQAVRSEKRTIVRDRSQRATSVWRGRGNSRARMTGTAMTSDFGVRDGETAIDLPKEFDAGLHFIGRIRTPWTRREDCPKNGREATDVCILDVDALFAEGLRNVEGCFHLHVLYWMDRAPRNLMVQKPRHLGVPRGVFALRSPARPNPIALSIVDLLSVDGPRLHVRGLDCLDGTALLDIKPYFASADAKPEATVAR
jgi:tRNA-Thr(GGU) m(6)t(6)A37 methyltransferase TsaA